MTVGGVNLFRLAWVALLAALIASGIAVLVLPVASPSSGRWADRDIQIRAQLIFTSIHDQVADLARAGNGDAMAALFERLAQDQRLIAVGFCPTPQERMTASARMPSALNCATIWPLSGRTERLALDNDTTAVSVFALNDDAAAGRLVVLHDMSLFALRDSKVRWSTLGALLIVALGGAALAAIASFLVMRQWVRAVQATVADLRNGRSEEKPAPGLPMVGSFGDDIRRALDELDSVRRSIDAMEVQWSPETLSAALSNELPGSEVLVVSNREPYIHSRTENGVTLQIPASGLVSALEPVVRACGGTWIAHGSGSADRETVDAHDRVAVPPDNPQYMLRRVWLSDEEQDGYYYGFSNEGLWPLCHIAFVRPIFREEDWQMYRSVNERFADAVASEAKRPDPIILIQDYHFALLPRMLRERLPNATIITFWHIPWPNAETFGICPHGKEIIDGLLGSSIVGFHTQSHCNNFLETVDRFVESRIDRETSSVTLKVLTTGIKPYPISIEWPPSALAAQAPVPECRLAVRRRYGLPDDLRLAVGIERFDYTKGIVDRMYAVDAFLMQHPDQKGHFALLQIAAPTRSKLASYRNLQQEAAAAAGEINARHGSQNYKPIILVMEHHEPHDVFELFRAADISIVSSLHDGMNLVAKEFVASRDDEQGVLILSAFAGASRDLGEALIVNPYDAHAMGEAIARALAMPEAEQRERMHLMREQVRMRNVYWWAGRMLLDAARLRKRQRIAQLAAPGETRMEKISA